MIYLDANILNALLPAASKDKDRPLINGVWIKDIDGKRIYTATNGHLLLRQITKIPNDSEPLPETGVLLNLTHKFKTTKYELVNMDIANGQAHIKGIKDEMFVNVYFGELQTGIEHVIEETEKNVRRDIWVPLSPRYLTIICDFFKTIALEEPYTDADDNFMKTHAVKWVKMDAWYNVTKLALLMPVRV